MKKRWTRDHTIYSGRLYIVQNPGPHRKKMVDEEAVEPHAFVLSSQSSKPPDPTTQKPRWVHKYRAPPNPDREGQSVGPHGPSVHAYLIHDSFNVAPTLHGHHIFNPTPLPRPPF